jgi:hypothetical protein
VRGICGEIEREIGDREIAYTERNTNPGSSRSRASYNS